MAPATEGDGEEFTAACSRPRGHVGEHRDDWHDVRWTTGTTWKCARCGMLAGVHALGAACPVPAFPPGRRR